MKSAQEEKRKKAASRIFFRFSEPKPNRFKKFDRYQLQPPSLLVVKTNRKCRKKSFSFSLPETTTGMVTNADTCFFSISGSSIVCRKIMKTNCRKKIVQSEHEIPAGKLLKLKRTLRNLVLLNSSLQQWKGSDGFNSIRFLTKSRTLQVEG